VLATNQSGLGRGLFDMAMLNAMHVRMNQMLAKHGGRIDAVFFCPHAPEDQCDCRKPLPGLMLQIGERYGVDLTEVPLVGDTLRDVQAGQAAGCPTHLVRTGKAGMLADDELTVMLQQVPGTKVHADLGAFADALIQEERLLRGLKGESDSGYGELG
jgi:D-glycero-D-manno-heptose 1,7-bisphosphate phosphatase